MRGPSLDAAAALSERLSSTQVAHTATVGEELFSVAQTLRSEGALRRFASDASVPAEGKTGLVERVFAGLVSAETLDLLKDAVGRRWSATRDLADTLEHLSVIAQVRSVDSGHSGTDTETDTQTDTDRAGGENGRLADELFEVDALINHQHDLRSALSDPGRSVQDKSALLESLLAGKTLDATLALAKQALTGTYRTIGGALTEYQRVAADVHGESVATVRVARPLDDGELGRLTDALSRQYDRAIHANVVVEPDLLGGIRVEIGDDVIDGTVSSRLNEARRSLAG